VHVVSDFFDRRVSRRRELFGVCFTLFVALYVFLRQRPNAIEETVYARNAFAPSSSA
jgi:hypothetical protein